MYGGLNRFGIKIFKVRKYISDFIEFELNVKDMLDGYLGNLNVLIIYRIF